MDDIYIDPKLDDVMRLEEEDIAERIDMRDILLLKIDEIIKIYNGSCKVSDFMEDIGTLGKHNNEDININIYEYVTSLNMVGIDYLCIISYIYSVNQIIERMIFLIQITAERNKNKALSNIKNIIGKKICILDFIESDRTIGCRIFDGLHIIRHIENLHNNRSLELTINDILKVRNNIIEYNKIISGNF